MKQSFTTLRKEILQEIEKSKYPLSAKEIQETLSASPDLSTVYRALKFLEKNKFIVGLNISKNIQYFFSASKPHSHFILCNECKKIEPFQDCVAKQIQHKVEKEYDYEISDHFLYFVGICKQCRAEKKQQSTTLKK